MAWLIVGGPQEYEASGVDPDTVRGWAYDIERGEERQTIRVELSALAVDDSAVVDEGCRQAISTRGRSAVEAFLDLDPPPTRLVIGTQGIGAPDMQTSGNDGRLRQYSGSPPTRAAAHGRPTPLGRGSR